MEIRYELLREANILPELDHPSVGGAILSSLQEGRVYKTQALSFIPPWFKRIRQGALCLGYGTVIPSLNEEKEFYIVEREIKNPTFSVRCLILNEDMSIRHSENDDVDFLFASVGLPSIGKEEDYFILAKGLTVQNASKQCKEYKQQHSEGFHFDVYPEGLLMFPDTVLYLGREGC